MKPIFSPNNRILDVDDVFFNFRDKCAQQEIMCPFLINNLCSIYEMRPIACRVHYVESLPNLCKKNRQRISPKLGSALKIHVIKNLKKSEEICLESLTYSVKDILLPNRKLKPMKKIVINFKSEYNT